MEDDESLAAIISWADAACVLSKAWAKPPVVSLIG